MAETSGAGAAETPDAPALHPNARAVMAAAVEHGLRIDIHEYPDGTRTAADAARAIGVDVGQIVKSLVFAVDGEMVVALVSGSNRLDESRLAAAARGERVARVDADAVRAATGYPIGGVPPFGHARHLRTFIDADLLAYRSVWAAAGTPRHNFAIAPPELVRITGGVVAPLA
jgi:Cys-tRNA(Pro) deacylase